MVAAFGGYVDPVRTLLGSRADPNAKDNQGRTALMAAVTNGDAAVVQALLGGGADFRAADAGGGVALTYAAAAGSAAAIDALQKKGARPTGHDLMLAASGCYTDAVRTLIASGANANATVDGNSPLMAATGENCVETVTLLLDRGANVNVTNNDGWTPLIKATSAGYTDVVRVLLQRGADMDVVDKLDRTAGMYASLAGHEEIAALFKEARAKK